MILKILSDFWELFMMSEVYEIFEVINTPLFSNKGVYFWLLEILIPFLSGDAITPVRIKYTAGCELRCTTKKCAKVGKEEISKNDGKISSKNDGEILKNIGGMLKNVGGSERVPSFREPLARKIGWKMKKRNARTEHAVKKIIYQN